MLTQTQICDAYSGGCVTVTEVPRAGTTATIQPSTPPPDMLPYTGFTYGELIMIAVLMLVVGFMALRLTRRRA